MKNFTLQTQSDLAILQQKMKKKLSNRKLQNKIEMFEENGMSDSNILSCIAFEGLETVMK